MSMNGSYGGHNNNLMVQQRYKRFIEDADSSKVLYEGIQKKYDGYVNDFYWNIGAYLGEVKKGNWTNAGEYAFPRVKQAEVHPNEASLDSKAINVGEVINKANQYQQLVDSIGKLSSELESLKEYLGKNKLSVDNKNYEIRIDEIRDKIENTYRIMMQEFVDAVKDRAPFVHDFQVCVQKDYIRYYGNESSYNRGGKTWSRTRDGWTL